MIFCFFFLIILMFPSIPNHRRGVVITCGVCFTHHTHRQCNRAPWKLSLSLFISYRIFTIPRTGKEKRCPCWKVRCKQFIWLITHLQFGAIPSELQSHTHKKKCEAIGIAMIFKEKESESERQEKCNWVRNRRWVLEETLYSSVGEMVTGCGHLSV